MVVARLEREEEQKEKERKSIIKLYRQERSSLGGERKKMKVRIREEILRAEPTI